MAYDSSSNFEKLGVTVPINAVTYAAAVGVRPVVNDVRSIVINILDSIVDFREAVVKIGKDVNCDAMLHIILLKLLLETYSHPLEPRSVHAIYHTLPPIVIPNALAMSYLVSIVPLDNYVGPDLWVVGARLTFAVKCLQAREHGAMDVHPLVHYVLEHFPPLTHVDPILHCQQLSWKLDASKFTHTQA